MIPLESGILDAIVAADSQSITAKEVSEATKQDELLVIRVMRMLTALGICEETLGSTLAYISNAEAKFLTNPNVRAGLG